MKDSFKNWIKSKPGLKHALHRCLIHPVKRRPRFCLRILLPLWSSLGKGSVIYSCARKDIAPFRKFTLGKKSVIESFSTINNLVGDLIIGEDSRVGIGSVVIGPVNIGNRVIVAQNVVISGIDHEYEDITTPIMDQEIATSLITIADDVWIGANSTITRGVKIGKHSIIAAGSVVVGDIPDYCVAAGVPARVIKKYDSLSGKWLKVPKS